MSRWYHYSLTKGERIHILWSSIKRSVCTSNPKRKDAPAKHRPSEHRRRRHRLQHRQRQLTWTNTVHCTLNWPHRQRRYDLRCTMPNRALILKLPQNIHMQITHDSLKNSNYNSNNNKKRVLGAFVVVARRSDRFVNNWYMLIYWYANRQTRVLFLCWINKQKHIHAGAKKRWYGYYVALACLWAGRRKEGGD